MKEYIWEVTSSMGQKWRIATEGFMVDEALTEFRRAHGYEPVIYSIVYFIKVGEMNGPSTD
ncbi:hypothetical protein H9650_00105 [Psychrobacillus sp. Sa2BUA9]|uniref:Uncharacterized protein n=1 Tax=Psychrobacillus faecigallinarum TaxID=2762235 RepID=A0ABR8R3Z3_9BACI|nr:hypothetical protein [Psychrobacillus faecigallinarum]MBD7942513.1 hypothetical protein [Psychrobacillus faecigallinarum]